MKTEKNKERKRKKAKENFTPCGLVNLAPTFQSFVNSSVEQFEEIQPTLLGLLGLEE
jgi:hypothetical protein